MVASAANDGFVQGNWKGLGTHGTLGIEIALGVILPTYVGHRLDRHYDTADLFVALGFVLGLAHGVRAVWRALQVANREAEQEVVREREARKKYFDDRE